MAERERVGIWRLGPVEVPLPRRMSADAAGMDLHAALAEPIVLTPRARVLIPTGIGIALPPDCEAQVRPRSGLAIRHGITVINSPGTVDADYRGEIQVGLVHHGEEPHTIEPLERIAQLVVARVTRLDWELLVADESGIPQGVATERGSGGFGHTGRTREPRGR